MADITTEIDERWYEDPAPFVPDAEVTLSAWTHDENLSQMCGALAGEVYAGLDVYELLAALRSQLRAGAMALRDAQEEVARSVVGQIDHLVNADTTDEQLDMLTAVAGAGHGETIPGLRVELGRLRDREREEHRSNHRAIAEAVIAAHTNSAWTVELVEKVSRSDLSDRRLADELGASKSAVHRIRRAIETQTARPSSAHRVDSRYVLAD
ncbi:hypothetical protein [Mycobacterium sp. D16Q16]|uniref:hypothetical protein n=1 Tax=Mycobacterium sp. D16Q16 TaxID=1855659 RepID=UPI0009937B96|nr:hypothetical protein [Mycobacterium sp. D16Q16]